MKTTIKFTGPGRTPLLGRNDYAPVGEWSEHREPLAGQRGWHVGKDDHLSFFLGAEMWVVTVRGMSDSISRFTAWEFIRFDYRVDKWDPVAFAWDCTMAAASYAANSKKGSRAEAQKQFRSTARAARLTEFHTTLTGAAVAAGDAASSAAYACGLSASRPAQEPKYGVIGGTCSAERKRQSDYLLRVAGLSGESK